MNNIRNFAIIAHVDHGKSTLADRLMALTGTLTGKDLDQEQFLDSNPISRERGITIKLAPVHMNYTLNATPYVLNLIDTPGHVDFSYEVVRTLYACEGAILVVDATKGIQAQTVSHFNVAKSLGLTIIPAINKVDLDSAEVEKVENEIVESFGFDKSEILRISAKNGIGVEHLLEVLIRKVPPPTIINGDKTQALIFDSKYDEHRGIVIFVRVRNGEIRKGDEIMFASDKSRALVMDVGFMSPTFTSTEKLANGDVGYVITNIKDITQAKVGDTMTLSKNPAPSLPGYKEQKPFVFLSIYPTSSSDFQNLRKALYSLKLTDAALVVAPDYSTIFGSGFRCGFLGLLHSQIVLERLEREYNLDVFSAPPSIAYLVDGVEISSPKEFDISKNDIKEPFIMGEVYTPAQYLGGILDLVYKGRGTEGDITYFGSQVKVTFEMPLSNIVYDFYDNLKSASAGYASFDYDFLEYRNSNLERVDISVNEVIVPELSFIVHKSNTEAFSRRIVEVLSKSIPKHSFQIAVRAHVGGKIIASEKIGAYMKDVTSKLYGGDRTRKDKLLDKQKEGKKKMKSIGRVNVPKEAFMSILKV
ncbi:MAG: translation elongation factor 4 [Candidatus Levybacteria bacterium]|nr:translation elongation factor 4 [Candidatus Levybacteria bacterium]